MPKLLFLVVEKVVSHHFVKKKAVFNIHIQDPKVNLQFLTLKARQMEGAIHYLTNHEIKKY